MKMIAAIVFAACSVSSAFAQQTTYNRAGNTVYGSDGSTHTRVGNSTFHSDGSTRV